MNEEEVNILKELVMTFQVVLDPTPEEKDLLVALGFHPKEVFLKRILQPFNRHVEFQGDHEFFGMKPIPPMFFTAGVWEDGERRSTVQVALCWQNGTEGSLRSRGYMLTEIYQRNVPGNYANSDIAIREGDNEFRTMVPPPKKCFTTSWWGAGAD